MNVTIDGIIYQIQSQGGISNLYDEILPRMCDEDDSLSIDLLTSGNCMKTLPKHPHINHHRLFPVDNFLRPTRIWKSKRFDIRAYFQNLEYQSRRGSVWHSTSFTIPYKWKGPVITSVYDLIYFRFEKNIFNNSIAEDYRMHQRQCIERADLVLCISETTKLDLEKYLLVDPGKIKVIHLAANPVFKQMYNTKDFPKPISTKPFFLYVGGRHLYKNFSNFLKAFSLWNCKKEFNLVVVGNTWTQNEKILINELNLGNHVILLTNIDNKALSLLYNHAKAFVFPSLYEGFGIPLLESMACGCPVLASKIPTTIEVAGDCPVYFEPNNIDSIISALNIIIDEDYTSERVQKGLTRVGRFSWDITAHKTLNVYHELMATN